MQTRSRAAKIVSMITIKPDQTVNYDYFDQPKIVNNLIEESDHKVDTELNYHTNIENGSDNGLSEILYDKYLGLQHVTGVERNCDNDVIQRLRDELLYRVPQTKEISFANLENVPFLEEDNIHSSDKRYDASNDLNENESSVYLTSNNASILLTESISEEQLENQELKKRLKQLELDKLQLQLKINRIENEKCIIDIQANPPDNNYYTTVDNVVIDVIDNFVPNNDIIKNTDNDVLSDVGSIISNSSGSEYFPSDGNESEVCDKEVNANSNTTEAKFPSEQNTRNTESQIEVDHVEQNQNETNERSIIIREASKTAEGKRNRDKIHSCYFCHKTYKEVSKHLQNKHANELEVAKVLATPKNTEERRKGFIRLTRVGDYYHNCEVLKRKDGELILIRMPTVEEKVGYTFNDYGPCPDCLGFMLKRHIWHHVKYGCAEKRNSKDNLRRALMSESTALLTFTYSDIPSSNEFNEGILAALSNDNISMICRQDNLIMQLAVMQFEKYHNTQNELIRQSMRQLGRLLMELRRIDPKKNSLSSWLKPIFFDNIVTALKTICKVNYFSKSRPLFSIPSLALKLGYSLKKCIAIQKGILLRKEDIQGVETLNSFLSLMDLEWCVKVSSSALATLNQRKMNSTELLPLTDDLVKLNEFINSKLREAKELLTNSPTFKNWSNLASLTLSKIVLFNKRRSGEASRITLMQYSSRPTWSQSCTQEFQNTFSELEMQLASRLTIVQITGKRGRTVSVLLTPDVKEAIDLLLLHRREFISSENPYLFARSNPSTEYIRGHDCLRNLSLEANLIQPELINGTKLRKYIATVCQIFNLTENETDWLARHLGHDVRVHREFYRLHESSVELTKVSRLLIAIERGEANKFHGKRLEEINICDLPELDLDENEQTNNEQEYEGPSNDSEEDIEAELTVRKGKQQREKEQDENQERRQTKTSKGAKKKKTERKKWNPQETSVVLAYFRNYIKKNTRAPPGKALCLECINSNKMLASRTWKDVKYFVYNYLKRINKK